VSETKARRRFVALRRSAELSRAALSRIERARAERLRTERARTERSALGEQRAADERHATRSPADEVPYSLRVAAAVCWRLLVVAGALVIAGRLVIEMSVVVIPVAVALLLAALLCPAVDALAKRGVPRGLATTVVLIGGLATVGGVLTFVVRRFITGLPDLQEQITGSIDTIERWLVTGPLRLSETELQEARASLTNTLSENREQITSGAMSVAGGVGHFVTGVLLVLFTLIFFLYDGRRIWSFLTRMLPRRSRDRIDVAGQRGFAALVGYVRASVLVAVVDAVFIGIGIWLVGLPLVVPLAALVFLGAFIPIIGAVVTGAVAVLVALVTTGPVSALIVLAIVIAVQQIEGHILQPLLMGRAVQIHPLVVVLAVAGGVVVAGIIGALLAVPLVAVLNAGARSLFAGDPETPQEVDALDPKDADVPPDVAPLPVPRDTEEPAERPADVRHTDNRSTPG
jgi:predicted PurR-regulated permease PerM